MSLSGTQRRNLKSRAHHLNPVIIVGQKGVTSEILTATDKALNDHELIKLKFIDFKDEKKELSSVIADSLNANLIDIIGNIAIYYRENIENK